MPQKPQKWNIKIWHLIYLKSHYIYDFNIYCGRNGGNGNVELLQGGELRIECSFVMKLMEGNHGKGHCIVVNIYSLCSKLLECFYWNSNF
jgi:hypothetical protein